MGLTEGGRKLLEVLDMFGEYVVVMVSWVYIFISKFIKLYT